MGATEWEMHMSDDGRPYYYNSRTQESTWEPPPSMMMSMMAGITKPKKNVEFRHACRHAHHSFQMEDVPNIIYIYIVVYMI